MLNFSTREASKLIKFIKGLDIDVHGSYNDLYCKVISYDNINKNVGIMIGGGRRRHYRALCPKHQYKINLRNNDYKCFDRKTNDMDCEYDDECISDNCHENKCKKKNKVGQTCVQNSNCISNICVNRKCIQNIKGGDYNIKYVSVTNITVNNIFI